MNRREIILNTAFELSKKIGVRRCSVGKITREMNILNVQFYAIFRSISQVKEVIYQMAIEKNCHEIIIEAILEKIIKFSSLPENIQNEIRPLLLA